MGVGSRRFSMFSERRLSPDSPPLRECQRGQGRLERNLTYYAFPKEYWRRIRTNNPLERLLRKIRRRTRVVGAFPDGQSALKTYVAALIKALGKLA